MYRKSAKYFYSENILIIFDMNLKRCQEEKE